MEILKLRCFYDTGNLTSTPRATATAAATFNRFPREYAALAYVLEISGFPVKTCFPDEKQRSRGHYQGTGTTLAPRCVVGKSPCLILLNSGQLLFATVEQCEIFR